MVTKGKSASKDSRMESIDRQVSTYMRGSEFGDSQIKEMMTRELRQKLIEAEAEGRPLRVYCGYDVTAPDLHLGHTITMHKLRQFQDFGHNVTFLIGTFTTLIGDPSDRDEARAMALKEQVKKNAETYAEQAFKILDRKKTSVRYNYDWLSKLTFADVINMASYFTVQQFLVRDRLRNRYDKNDPIWLRELLYPLAQGYDAVFLQTDVQLGATEQLFNLMAGRRLQEAFGQPPQVCITFPVLVGTDGVERMSKSRGNYIGIAEPPENIYGKTMSIPDGIIMQYFELLTDVPDKELKEFKRQLDSGANPMSLKKRLARELVAQYYSAKEAQQAEEHFEKTVQNKEIPENINIIVKVPAAHLNIKTFAPTIVQTGLAKSNSEANRLIRQGAVSIDGKKITGDSINVKNGSIIKIGKRMFAKVIIQET
jgi:tyrosyl-tRNA synthetase